MYSTNKNSKPPRRSGSNLIISLSLMAALSLAAQPQEFDPNNIESVSNKNQLVLQINNDLTETTLEEFASFDFDTKAYLPENFDPYKGMILDEAPLFDQSLVSFDFKTQDYLPNGFDPYQGMFLDDGLVVEEDAPFEFDQAAYLPLGFNPNLNLDDLAQVEDDEDASFDFDTESYLPINFDPLKDYELNHFSGLEVCDIYPSI